MTTIVTAESPSKVEIEQAIIELLDDLPIDALVAIRYFVEYLHAKANGRTPNGVHGEPKRAMVIEQASHVYPTIGVPPAQLLKLAGIMPPVGGDALKDTEALFDEV